MNLLELFWLVISHYIGDFALQPGWMGQRKDKDPHVLIAHCLIWTGVVSLVLTIFNDLSLWKILLLFFGHLICDFLKHQVYYKLPFHIKNSIDQGFHLFQILIVWLF